MHSYNLWYHKRDDRQISNGIIIISVEVLLVRSIKRIKYIRTKVRRKRRVEMFYYKWKYKIISGYMLVRVY